MSDPSGTKFLVWFNHSTRLYQAVPIEAEQVRAWADRNETLYASRRQAWAVARAKNRRTATKEKT